MLTLTESGALLLKHRLHAPDPATAPAVPAVPRRVMQYWDRLPPPQIQQLIERNRQLCARVGATHVLFDDAGAREFLRAHGEARALSAYELAAHPAMKCDIFRLCYLYHEGGYYVDADIVLRPNLGELFALPGALVVFQWDSRGIDNLCNWLIGAQAEQAVLRGAVDATVHSVVNACRANPEAALRNILAVSGPGIFTQGIATALAAGDAQRAASVRVETVSRAHQLIQLGPSYLKQPLDYKNKSDTRHWQAAAAAHGTTPPDSTARPAAGRGPDATQPAPSTAPGWWSRLIGRLRVR